MISVLRQGPHAEPIEVSALRSHLHLDAGEEPLLASLITSARLVVEAQAGVRLISQEWDVMLDAWPPTGEISLPHWPIMSVSEVRLSGETPQFISTEAYELIQEARPALLLRRAHDSWPNPQRNRLGIVIRIIAGYGDDATDIPKALQDAIKMLAAHWYETNEWNSQSIASVVPGQVNALMHPFRSLRV